jgi:hypothetical protein
VPPPEPAAGEATPVPPLAPSKLRVSVEVPKRRLEEEIRAAMPREASGSESGTALFARWQADWRVVPQGRPSIAVSRGRVTAEADAMLEVEGRLGRTSTRCGTKVHVHVDGRLRLRPDWTVTLEEATGRADLGPCRLSGFPMDASGILQPIAQREIDRNLARAAAEPYPIRGVVAQGWDEMSRDREIGPIHVRTRPESLAVGELTCRRDTCAIDLEIGAAPEAWIDSEPPTDEGRPLPDAAMLGTGRGRGVDLRARLNLSSHALALLAALPDAEGEGEGARTAELRIGTRGVFVTIRDAGGRGLAHLPIDVAPGEGGLVLARGHDGAGLAWPAADDPCLGAAGQRLVQRFAEAHPAQLPGEDLVALLEGTRIDGLDVHHEVRGFTDGSVVVDVVARARSVVVRVE